MARNTLWKAVQRAHLTRLCEWRCEKESYYCTRIVSFTPMVAAYAPHVHEITYINTASLTRMFIETQSVSHEIENTCV